MTRSVFGESVQGAAHIRSGKECQDSLKKVERGEDALILAVADGHGSDACPYSRTGADTAVNVFCRIMEDYLDTYAAYPETLLTFLKREGDTKVAQAIEAEWKRRILRTHAVKKRGWALDADGNKDKDAVYRLYGSTLVGLVMTKEFLFAFQLGDGDIMEVSQKGVQSVIEADKILGTETHSLSRPEAWRKDTPRSGLRIKNCLCCICSPPTAWRTAIRMRRSFKRPAPIITRCCRSTA